MGFPKVINQQQAPAIAGDFCSANPRSSVNAGEGTFVVGATGLVVGFFGWADVAGLVTNAGSGAPTGFVHRDQQALITGYLGVSGLTIPTGFPCTLMRGGDFWVKTLTTATVGQKVFASNTTGDIKTGAAGATISGYTETVFFVDSAAAANELIKMSKGG